MEKLIKALQESAINDYKIVETKSHSSELFYVADKLETSRATDLKNVEVTIYVDVEDKRGSASFIYNDFMDDEEIKKVINDKIFASKFALNQFYEIPSKNAEPIKKWLAKLGSERIDETFDPSIAVQRAIDTYRAKGYPED